MDVRPTARKIRFGDCVLDEGRGALTVAGGAETVLRPKTFELLRLMLNNPGRVVSRNEILDAVWPGLFVTDDSITQCVVEIRRAMGEAGAAVLRTMPRRGYLLEAEVAVDAPPEPLAAPLLSPRSDDRPSIAVLPFRMGGGAPEEAYFADGIIEGIVHVLSGLDGLFVVSRGSALAFAQTSLDPRAAGRELGVRYVLYGGVRRAAGRLRVTTELSETERGTILRTDRHDGQESDIFEMQDRIAEQVAVAILPQVRAEELARAMRKPPSSLTAYDYVLRALDRIQRMDAAGFAEADDLLRQSIAADPAHALAHTTTAWLRVLRIAQGWSPDIAADAAAAEAAAFRAVDLDHGDALALALKGFVTAFTRHELEPARRLLDQAVAASPSCALAWTYGAAIDCWLEQPLRAIEWAERGLRLAPNDVFTFLHEHILSQAHYGAGDLDQAIAWSQRSIASNPRHSGSWRVLAAAQVGLGRIPDAQESARRMLELEPGFHRGALAARTPLRGATRDRFLAALETSGLPD
jgi:TolB-like protein